MPNDANELLRQQLAQQLRDIDLPEPVSWWPLAIGWWILIVAGVLISTLLIIKIVRHYRQNKYRKAALSDMQLALKTWQDDHNITHYLQSINSLLKRVVREIDPNSSASSISKSGSAWGDILQRYAREPLSDDTLAALTDACYRADPKVDVPELHRQIGQWLTTHQRGAHA